MAGASPAMTPKASGSRSGAPRFFGACCPAWPRRLSKHAPAETSDRGRAAQCIAPMRYPLLEGTLAPVSQLLEIDLFEDLEGETFRPMGVPGGLKRLVPLDALPHANERRVQIVERSGAAATPF